MYFCLVTIIMTKWSQVRINIIFFQSCKRLLAIKLFKFVYNIFPLSYKVVLDFFSKLLILMDFFPLGGQRLFWWRAAPSSGYKLNSPIGKIHKTWNFPGGWQGAAHGVIPGPPGDLWLSLQEGRGQNHLHNTDKLSYHFNDVSVWGWMVEFGRFM